MDENYNENIGFYIFCTIIYIKYSRVKYNDSRELPIMIIIINVLLVIINHAKEVNIIAILFTSL